MMMNNSNDGLKHNNTLTLMAQTNSILHNKVMLFRLQILIAW